MRSPLSWLDLDQRIQREKQTETEKQSEAEKETFVLISSVLF